MAAYVVFGQSVAESWFSEPGLGPVVRTFSIAIPIYIVGTVTAAFAQSQRQIRRQQAIRVSAPSSNFIIVCALLALGFGLTGVAYAYVVAGVASALVGVYFAWRVLGRCAQTDSKALREVAGRLLRYSLPLCAVPLASTALYHADRIMLAVYLDSADVGVYNACVVLAAQVLEFSAPLVIVLSPIVAGLVHESRNTEIEYLYRTATRWMATASLVGVATGPKGMFLHMSGYPHVDAINGAVALVANIVLNALLIPRFGMHGAAYATGIVVSMAHVARLVEVYVLCRMLPYDRWILAPIGAGVAGSVVGWLVARVLVVPLGLSSYWAWLPGFGAYVFAMLRGGLTPADRETLALIRRRM